MICKVYAEYFYKVFYLFVYFGFFFYQRWYIFVFARGVIIVFEMFIVAPVDNSYVLKKFSISRIDFSVNTKKLVSSAY